MPLVPGQRLLQLLLVERAGAGGMGEVWRARDEALGRDVAVKLLPEAVATDPERRARFEREARLLATLDHPAIARVYGFHEDGGLPFLVLEFVEGEDLAARLERGPLAIDEALETAIAIARALEAAHAQGIVHRDLKPANIRRTPGGAVKVLDFGLAKALAPPEGASADVSLSPTITYSQTAAGVLLGTAAYMSPEQARGRPVDRRADLWAFGCTLYEFLTGARAFGGETLSDTLAAVIRGEPDWSRLPPGLPPRVENLLRHCLAKDPEERWRDAGDARLELRRALGEAGTPETAGAIGRGSAAPRRLPLGAIAAAALLGLAAGAALVATLRPGDPAPARVVEAAIPVPAGWTPLGVAISPDGSTIGAHVEAALPSGEDSPFRLLLRRVHASEPVLLEGAAWGVPRFAPDSSQLAFPGPDPSGQGQAIFRAPIDGTKPPLLVARLAPRSAREFVWLDGTTLALAEGDPARVRRIPIDGRPEPPAVALQTTVAGSNLQLHGVLPGGALLGTIESWLGGYHQDVVRIDLDQGTVTELARNAYVPTLLGDRLLFSRRDRLLAVPLDRARGAVVGAEEVVATGLGFPVAWGGAPYGLSAGGDLVHLMGGALGEKRPLVWVGAGGERLPWEGASGAFIDELDDSRDGRVVAATRIGRDYLFEIWASGIDRAAFRRVLAFEGMDCQGPSVSPDGDRIASFCGGDPEREGIYLARLAGDDRTPRRVVATPGDAMIYLSSWSPDGRTIFATVVQQDRSRVVAVDPAARERAEIDSLPTVASEAGGFMLSDDGRFAALGLRSAPTPEVAIAPWRDGRLGTPVPLAPGSEVEWTGVVGAQGRELVFRGRDGRLRHTFVDDAGRPGPVELHPSAATPSSDLVATALLNDGRVLAVQKELAEREGGAIALRLGWGSTLGR